MGRRSWIHLIRSKNDYEKILEGFKNNEFIFEVGGVVLDGIIHCEFSERVFGEEGRKSLVTLSQSDGSSVIDELIEAKAIEDWNSVLCLDDIATSDIDHTKKGGKIKNARYLTYDEFQDILEKLEEDESFNNTNYQSYLEQKGTGILFMCYFSRILLGFYGILNDHHDSEIETLFGDVQEIVEVLGLWCHGDKYPVAMLVDDVSDFMENAHLIKMKEFDHLSIYIEYIGNDFVDYFTPLKKGIWSEIPEPRKFPLEVMMISWQLGELQVRISDISQTENVPIPLQPFVALKEVYLALGKWIYGDGDKPSIIKEAERLMIELEAEQDPVFQEAFDLAKLSNEKLVEFLVE